MRFAQALSVPSWVVLQLVEECNLRCAMCYEWGDSGAYHDKPKMASLDLDVALRVIGECLPARPYFELFGGEPLLHPGIWEIIRVIRDAGSELAFPTNGTLIAEHAEALVETQPSRVWISLDGPERVNDAQRGNGVFKRVMRGLDALAAAKRKRGTRGPELGITYVVTPTNHLHIEELFFGAIDLAQFSCVSIELQSYATEEEHRRYARLLREEFGVPSAPYARAYVRDPALFAAMDRAAITRQMTRVRDACGQRGIRFYSQPKTLELANVDCYLRGDWEAMVDRRSRCAFPWTYAEISARGDVTTCHSFYDLTIGNVYEQPLLEIWRGERLKRLQAHLRQDLFSICTACCRYYS
ncbi:MAG: radical protein [bacterium]|nr:radical protein [bacterium]